ncbi:uncharacterized protein si:dkey-154b15.1 [Anguilla anguilla]|uniref:uncharacterized protein si:dkey-154b15.1 n=1 Tax=Anguilla anguilla TaxID=7936 RepID=UPI0015A79814|nr:uncharacterized protein si:dkey-154b15.1 [Anguilla anguilla]
MNEGAQLLVPMLDARSIAMDAGFTAVEVRGVPRKLPEDRMIDKLTIHFLRPRNGGGEVLRVVYSDQAPHRAFVVFERPEVAARVLQRAHVLQLEGQSFPLTVRPGEHAEVDLPVRATLDLRQFRDQDAALSILRRHGFKVNRQHPGQALLEGTFLSLSAARVRLAELLASEGQSRSLYPEPRPSVLSQGAVDKWGLSSNADMSYRLNGAKVDAGSWSPKDAKQSPTSFSSVTPSRVPSPGSAASFLYDSPPGGRPSASPHHRDHASYEGQSQSSYLEPRPSVLSEGGADKWGLSSNADMSYRLNGAKVDARSWSPKEAKQLPTSFSSVTPSRVPSPGSAASFLYDSPPGGQPSASPHHRDHASYEGQSQSSYLEPRPSVLSEGGAAKWGLSSEADMSYRLNGAKVDAGRWSPKDAKQSPTSFSSVTPSRVPSPGSAASFLYDSPPGGRPSASPRDRASFAVDTHALRYAGSFRNDEVQEILQEHGVQMEVQHVDGSGVSTVVLAGRHAPQAEDKLAGLLREVQAGLRTQEIPLSSMSQERQRQVGQLALKLGGIYKVLVLQTGDALQLVGSSSKSYELKQRILGEEGSRPSSRREGVEQERGRQPGRSASLPRRPAREGARDSGPGSAAAGGYDPSKYDQGPGGKGPGRGGRADPTPPTDPRRKRSVSESRSKEKEGRATPGQGDNHRVPPAGASTTPEKEQTSKKKSGPTMLKNLFQPPQFIDRNFLRKKKS